VGGSSLPPLLGLHAYEAAARHLSFAAAAAEMHLSASAVSQRVRGLEAHLGVRLFERLPRSLRLTEMGEAYLPAVRDIFDDLSAATSGLFGGSDVATLTVRVQVSYAATWLAPRLPDFCETFPHIDVQLVSAIWADALPPSKIDLEIRQGSGSWPGFIASKLHDDTAIAICGPQYLRRFGPARELEDLVPHSRVRVLGFDDLWRRFFPTEETHKTEPPRALTVDTSVAAMEIVANSDYWTIVPERFTRRAVAAGTIFPAWHVAVPMRQHHYLLRREDASRLSGEALAFIRWLRAQDLGEGQPL
jgi:LysR family glycine cleavage system transcriptional activator